LNESDTYSPRHASSKLILTLITSLLVSSVPLKRTHTLVVFTIGVCVVGVGSYVFESVIPSKVLIGIGDGCILGTLSPLTALLFEGKALNIVNATNNAAPIFAITGIIAAAGTVTGAMSETAFALSVTSGITAVLLLIIMRFKGKEAEQSERASVIEGLKNPFNWLFGSVFSCAVAFIVICFTFLSAEMTMPFLYAGCAGLIAGIFISGKYEPNTAVKVLASLTGLVGIPFALTGNPYLGMVAGFCLFSSFGSYMSIAFLRPGANAMTLGITFMMLWILNDIFAIGGTQIFSLAPEELSGIFLALLIGLFSLGSNYLTSKRFNGSQPPYVRNVITP